MESEADFPSRWGNTMLFAFAGHDTTGHTLTWLSFELAKNPAIQERLRAEVSTQPLSHLGSTYMLAVPIGSPFALVECCRSALRPAVRSPFQFVPLI